MFNDMLAMGAGGGSSEYFNYPMVEEALVPFSTRAQNLKSGYFVKNGICFFEVFFDANFNSTGDNGYIMGLPASTSGETSAGYLGVNKNSAASSELWKVQTISTTTYIVATNTTARTGDKYHIIGAYPTTAADTV